jgi:hypothetical protein
MSGINVLLLITLFPTISIRSSNAAKPDLKVGLEDELAGALG